jgi:hypothetical protein
MPGDEFPDACRTPYELCVLMSKLANLTWAEFQPLFDPGIVQELGRPDWVTNPGHYLDRFASQLSEIAQTSTRSIDRIALRMTSSPERIASMFHAAPEEFVGMFGNQGFEQIIGPAIGKVVGKPMDPAKLTPAGAEAYAAFERMRGALPGGITGAIGTFAPPAAGP